MPPKNLGKLPRDLTTTIPLSPGYKRAKHTQERKMPTRAAAKNKGTGYYNENKLAAASYQDCGERRETWQNQAGVMQGRVVKAKAKAATAKPKTKTKVKTEGKTTSTTTTKPKAKEAKKTPTTKTKEKSKVAGKGVKVTKASSSSQSKSKSPTKKVRAILISISIDTLSKLITSRPCKAPRKTGSFDTLLTSETDNVPRPRDHQSGYSHSPLPEEESEQASEKQTLILLSFKFKRGVFLCVLSRDEPAFNRDL
jgi:hypothetical protein